MIKAEIEALVTTLFAPWVQQLDIQVDAVMDENVIFTLPENDSLIRSGGAGGGVVCGQSLAAAIDTTSVLALAHFNNRFRACTTTDLHVRFMRALPKGPVELSVSVLSNGRTMAVMQAACRVPGQERICAVGSATMIYLEE